MRTLATERLALTRLSARDAEFIYGQLNEPSFLHFIGDRGVHSIDNLTLIKNLNI